MFGLSHLLSHNCVCSFYSFIHNDKCNQPNGPGQLQALEFWSDNIHTNWHRFKCSTAHSKASGIWGLLLIPSHGQAGQHRFQPQLPGRVERNFWTGSISISLLIVMFCSMIVLFWDVTQFNLNSIKNKTNVFGLWLMSYLNNGTHFTE